MKTLELAKGRHVGGITVEEDLAIVGAGAAGTTISAGGKGFLIAVNEDGVRLTIRGVTLSEGALNEGGALQITGTNAVVLVEDCVFTGNRATRDGGAIYVREAELTVRRSRIEKNAAGDHGGGLLAGANARVTLEEVTIAGNFADRGGGIFVRDDAVLTLRDTTVRDNGAEKGATALEARGTTAWAPAIEMQGGGLHGNAPVVGLARAERAKVGPKLRAKGATLPAALKTLRDFMDGGENRFV